MTDDEVKRLLLGAEAMAGVHHGQPSAISVGTGRVYTVAEAVLWGALFGPRYTTYVAGWSAPGRALRTTGKSRAWRKRPGPSAWPT